MTEQLNHEHAPAKSMLSGSSEFEEETDGFFQDDDLLGSTELADVAEALANGLGGGHEKNFLERDDFEEELGSPAQDAFSEDFSDISRHEIIDIVGADKAGRILIVAYAHRLPSNKTFDHAKFLRYLQHTLDKYVDQDYTIVYFHFGLKSHNKPPLSWLVKAYKVLDRRYKKNLKALYLVHPTNFIKIAWNIFKPIISKKFERKLNYVNHLAELREIIRSDQFIIPKVIENHDRSLRIGRSQSVILPQEPLASQQFGVTIDYILEKHRGRSIPPVVEQCISYIRQYGLETEGVFRRSVALSVVKNVLRDIDHGRDVDFSQHDSGVHLAAVVLKNFFRELSIPVMTFEVFPDILEVQSLPNDQRTAAVKNIIRRLPNSHFIVLKYLFSFLIELIAKSDVNLMNASNLAVVFGPNMAWPKDSQTTLTHLHHLNNFTYRLMTNFGEIF